MSIGASLFLIAIGAILAFAVDAHVEGFDLDTIGVIFMVLGGVGLLASLLWTRTAGYRRVVRRDYVDDDDPLI